MKFKKIIDLCKRSETMYLYNAEDGTQWISDGYSMFPINGMTELSIDMICRMFDISDSKREKMMTNHFLTLPESFDFSDIPISENACSIFTAELRYSGKQLVAIRTSSGIKFIEKSYLAPFDDEDKSMTELYERTMQSGETYFAVKKGLLLRGIILPIKIVSEKFVNELELMSTLCRAEYENRMSGGRSSD